MSETVKPQVTNEGGTEKAPRNRAQILSDLFELRKKAAKGEVRPDKVIEAHYGAAKELLETGKDQEAFFMLTSTMQLEAAYMGRTTVHDMGEVVDDLKRVGNNFGGSIEELGKSANKIGQGAEILQGVGSKIGGAAQSMEMSSNTMNHASDGIREASSTINRASNNMQEAAQRMHR